jgi:hypothetical protein
MFITTEEAIQIGLIILKPMAKNEKVIDNIVQQIALMPCAIRVNFDSIKDSLMKSLNNGGSMKDPTNKSNDINMPNTQISSVRNKVAECMAHGLNANEIQKEIPKISKAQLVRVIMDLLEKPNTDEEGSTLKPTDAQIATILYALRMLQYNYKYSNYPTSEHMKDLTPLTEKEIDTLCQDINFSKTSL